MVKYGLSRNVLVQNVVSETVLLDIDKGEYFELNELGSEMLKRLRDLGDPRRVIASLLADYEVEEETLTRDFRELLSQMESHGLVVKIKENGGAST